MQHDFILLDRSGSMGNQWERALTAVNGYVHGIAEEKVDTGVTMVAFDSDQFGKLQFDVVRDRIIPKTWKNVDATDASPRGGTPLSDAIGRLVALAEIGTYDKVAIIIMTDGHENASREYSVDAAKAALDRCRRRGWQVIFLGANFDNASQGRAYGAMPQSTVQVASANLAASGSILASKRGLYSNTGATMDFLDAEKDQLKK